jgi:hypothetical protein
MKTFSDLKQELLKAKKENLILDLLIYPTEVIFYLPRSASSKIPELTNYITANFEHCKVIGYRMNDDVYSARVFVEYTK